MAAPQRVDVVDVAVVGGGPAGVAAAISAARLGARTLLVERSEWLGGNATNAFVHTICGLFAPADEGDERAQHEKPPPPARAPPLVPGRVGIGQAKGAAGAAPSGLGLGRVHGGDSTRAGRRAKGRTRLDGGG